MEKKQKELENLLKFHNDCIDCIVSQSKLGLIDDKLAINEVWKHCEKKKEIVEKLKELDI